MGLRLLPLILSIVIVVVALLTVVVGFYAHFDSEWLKWKTLEKREIYRLKGLHKMCDGYPLSESQKKKLKEILPPGTKVSIPEECPDIAMERVFLVLAFICFLGAIMSVVLVVLNKGDNKALDLSNGILHAVLAFLIFIGAVLFIVSAVQAQEFHKYFHGLFLAGAAAGGRSGESEGTTPASKSERTTPAPESELVMNLGRSGMLRRGVDPDSVWDDEVQPLMRFEAKLAAGAFGIFQVILHAVAACVMMSGSGNAQEFQPQPMYFDYPQQSYPQQPNAQPDPNATNQGQEPQAQAAT